jgi:hypothetical protein
MRNITFVIPCPSTLTPRAPHPRCRLDRPPGAASGRASAFLGHRARGLALCILRVDRLAQGEESRKPAGIVRWEARKE